MVTIVGLGNPGTKYEDTRHNAGRIVLADFLRAHQFREPIPSSAFVADISEGIVAEQDVRVLFPHTFMNKSGSSIKKAITTDENIANLIVVYDELDLPIGTFKISFGRGSGGHNGIESVVAAIGSRDFVRVRVGISPVSLFGNMKKPPKDRVGDFVLKPFTRRERAKIDVVAEEVTKALDTIIMEGKEKAMNRWN